MLAWKVSLLGVKVYRYRGTHQRLSQMFAHLRCACMEFHKKLTIHYTHTQAHRKFLLLCGQWCMLSRCKHLLFGETAARLESQHWHSDAAARSKMSAYGHLLPDSPLFDKHCPQLTRLSSCNWLSSAARQASRESACPTIRSGAGSGWETWRGNGAEDVFGRACLRLHFLVVGLLSLFWVSD